MSAILDPLMLIKTIGRCGTLDTFRKHKVPVFFLFGEVLGRGWKDFFLPKKFLFVWKPWFATITKSVTFSLASSICQWDLVWQMRILIQLIERACYPWFEVYSVCSTANSKILLQFCANNTSLDPGNWEWQMVSSNPIPIREFLTSSSNLMHSGHVQAAKILAAECLRRCQLIITAQLVSRPKLRLD